MEWWKECGRNAWSSIVGDWCWYDYITWINVTNVISVWCNCNTRTTMLPINDSIVNVRHRMVAAKNTYQSRHAVMRYRSLICHKKYWSHRGVSQRWSTNFDDGGIWFATVSLSGEKFTKVNTVWRRQSSAMMVAEFGDGRDGVTETTTTFLTVAHDDNERGCCGFGCRLLLIS